MIFFFSFFRFFLFFFKAFCYFFSMFLNFFFTLFKSIQLIGGNTQNFCHSVQCIHSGISSIACPHGYLLFHYAQGDG
ncbi:hypothetical protein C1X05_08760 [Laceyella sacchari]|nr:hypothetical protein C1X05_08760 [Laceyella sacchari]